MRSSNYRSLLIALAISLLFLSSSKLLAAPVPIGEDGTPSSHIVETMNREGVGSEGPDAHDPEVIDEHLSTDLTSDELDSVAENSHSVVLDSMQRVDEFAQELNRKYKALRSLRKFLPRELRPTLGNQARFERQTRAYHILERAYNHYNKRDGVASDEVMEAIDDAIFVLAGLDSDDKTDPTPAALKAYTKYRRYLPKQIIQGFEEYAAYEEDLRIPVSEVEVIYFGDEPMEKTSPRRLEGLLRYYYAGKYHLHVRQLPAKEFEKIRQELEAAAEKIVFPGADKEEDPSKRKQAFWASLNLRNALANLKHVFGIALPENVIRLKIPRQIARNRTPEERVIEGASAGFIASTVSWVTYSTLDQQRAAGELVNTFWPTLLTIADKIFYTFFQRPVSAFFGSGMNFDYEQNAMNIAHPEKKSKNPFVPNRYWFSFTTAMNSFFLRFLNISGKDLPRLTNPQDPLTVGMVAAEAAGSSIRGQYSKSPIQFFLEKIRKSELNPRTILIIFTLWNAFWGMAQIGDMYDVKWHIEQLLGHQLEMDLSVRDVMTVLALIGFANELRKNVPRLARRWWAIGRDGVEDFVTKKPSPCNHFLVVYKRVK